MHNAQAGVTDGLPYSNICGTFLSKTVDLDISNTVILMIHTNLPKKWIK